MTREHVSYGGEGAVRGTGPMSGSGSARDPGEDPPGLGLFEKWGREARNGDVPEPDERAQGSGRQKQSLPKSVAVSVYEEYWTTDRTMRSIAEEEGIDHRSVSRIVRRVGHFREKTAGVAARLGHPDREAS